MDPASTQSTGKRATSAVSVTEGLAWWGITVVAIAAILGVVDSGGTILTVIAVLGAIVTGLWFHLYDDPFAERTVSTIAIIFYIGAIAAANYYTGGIDSPLFILYFAPLLAAFFMFDPKLQLILGLALHTCFTAQFLTPVALGEVSPDWPLFIFRSVQLAALGLFAWYAANAVRDQMTESETRLAQETERGRLILSAARAGHDMSADETVEDILQDAARSAGKLLSGGAAFVALDDDGSEENVDQIYSWEFLRGTPERVRTDENLAMIIPELFGRHRDNPLASETFLHQVLAMRAMRALFHTVRFTDLSTHVSVVRPGCHVLIGVAFSEGDKIPADLIQVSKVLGDEVSSQLARVMAQAEANASKGDEAVGSGVGTGSISDSADNASGGASTAAATERSSSAPPFVPSSMTETISGLATTERLSDAVEVARAGIKSAYGAADVGVYVMHESNAVVQEGAPGAHPCRFPDSAKDCPAIMKREPIHASLGSERCRFADRSKKPACVPMLAGTYPIGVIQLQAPTASDAELRDELEILAHALSAPLAGVRAMERRDPTGFFDRLTDAYSRPFATLFLERAHTRAQRTGKAYTLAVFGIDGMQEVNDRAGQLAGDRILQSFVETTRNALDSTELLGRWEEDLFIMAIEDSDKDIAFEQAETVRKASSHAFKVLAGGFDVSVSAGIATSFGGGSLNEVIELSMKRLARAKALGGDRIEATAAF